MSATLTLGCIAYKAASPGVDFAAGVVAGAAGLIVGQPFDVVKVRYQSPQFNGKYGNTFGAIGAIMREEGVSSRVFVDDQLADRVGV